MLTVGKQRQESTVGNVTTVWKAKRREITNLLRSYTFLSFSPHFKKWNLLEIGKISECAIVLNHHYFYLV
jgi:hypothetical protein